MPLFAIKQLNIINIEIIVFILCSNGPHFTRAATRRQVQARVELSRYRGGAIE